MKLDVFHDLVEFSGPFASVTLDVTRTDPANATRLETRWRDVEEQLHRLGAPEEVVASMGDAAVAPTGRGGAWGRLLVADSEGLRLHRDLPGRPDPDVSWGPVPSLLSAVRVLSSNLPHVVVRVDHTGADIEVNGGPEGADEDLEVQGDHDVLHRFKGGGWSQRRYELRVHDSWEHNAATVAHRLDAIVRRQRPQFVVVMGDERAVTYLEQHAGEELRALIVRSDTGGRARGTDVESERLAVEEIVAAFRARTEADVVARFVEQSGRAQAAVEGLEAVVEVLQRAQAEEVLLVDGRPHAEDLWVGQSRLQLGTSREDARMTGAHDPVKVAAEVALVWAAVCSRAGLTLLDPAQVDPADGVAAVLRWADESTPTG